MVILFLEHSVEQDASVDTLHYDGGIALPAALAWLEAQAGFRSPAFQVEQFCLFESTRDESGLVYRVVNGFQLP